MNSRASNSLPREPSPKKRVLIVEDDSSISLGLQINLEAEGYDAIVAEDGEKACEIADSFQIDLILLDVMLPKLNGFEVLQALRKQGKTMPIIILSARTSEMDKVTGLELGAEDYVAKPFGLAELLARIRAALRRVPASSSAIDAAVPTLHTFGDIVVDLQSRRVMRKGELVEMTATEFDLLLFLIEERGRALTREAIFQKVWGPNHHGTQRTIDNFMQQLRAKLEEDPQNPKYFQTVRGVGYRFN